MHSKFINVPRHGGPAVLEVATQEVAPPTAGQALVRVVAAGVSGGDVLMRAGAIPGSARPPYTPGFDIAGVVESVGPEVSELAPGQRVVALVRSGGYSELVTVPADRLVPVPDAIELPQAAASALNYYIAHQMLHRVVGVQAGNAILIHGAGGGVGTAFLQLGKLAGLDCLGTASASKHDLVRELGGWPIDYQHEDFVQRVRERTDGNGVVAAFDPIGGKNFRRSYQCLAPGGKLVGFGQSAVLRDGRPDKLAGALGFITGLIAPKLLPDGKSTAFYTAWSLERSQPQAYREDLTRVLDLLAAGTIRPVLTEQLPLVDAARAQQMLESGTVKGKIVLISSS